MKKKKQQNKRALDTGVKICVVTQQSYPREEMLRFVISPSREVVFDAFEKLPGFGIWVHADGETLEKAISLNMYGKKGRGPCTIPENFLDKIKSVLKNQCINLLGLARKSGYVAFGFEGVKKELENQNVALAFEANDSSVKGQGKLYRPTDKFSINYALSREELGQITGQDAQVHLVVLKSKIATQIKTVATKLDLIISHQKKG